MNKIFEFFGEHLIPFIIFYLITTILFHSPSGNDSETKIKSIKADTNTEINIELNNVPFMIKDDNDRELLPIIYNGKAYLPIKDFGKSIDLDVSFNSVTQTIKIKHNK